MQTSPELHLFERPQRERGFDLPARMCAIPLAGGGLALVSPLEIDDEREAALRALGEVRYLIAPNLLHHLHLGSALARFPGARVLAPEGLTKKRPKLAVHGHLGDALPEDLAAAIEVVRIEGAPLFDEFAIFHPASETLILTDLVFHVTTPRGFVTNLVLFLNGCRGRLAVSRVWSFAVKDRAATQASLARLLDLPFTRVVVAHGELLITDAKPRLREALRARFGAPALPG